MSEQATNVAVGKRLCKRFGERPQAYLWGTSTSGSTRLRRSTRHLTCDVSLEQRELIASFQNVPQDDNTEPDASDDQAKPPERLKDRDVGVLNFLEIGQTPPGRSPLTSRGYG